MKTYYQILNNSGDYGTAFCVEYHETPESADKSLQEWRKMESSREWWIEEGTEHIRGLCRGCGDPDTCERSDAHGITTGRWCDGCYDGEKYPYRKDRYETIETHGYGERLNDDY